MRAITIPRYGGNDLVELTDMPMPEVGPADVRIRVHAASLNPLDFKTRNGKAKLMLPYRFPLVLGNDLAGVVESVGPAVRRFKPGDEVFVRLNKRRIGGLAEYACALEGEVAPKPARLTFEEAASIPLVGLTAWQALIELGGVKPGQKVLIHAGSGGVGTFAIQLAKHLGAFVVTTTSTKNVELVRSLGADQVIDYRKEQFDEVVRDVDMVFETIGGDTLKRSFRVLKPGGVLVSIASLPDPATARRWGMSPIMAAVLWLVNWPIRRRARAHGVRYHYLFMEENGSQLEQIGKLIEAGAIRPVIDRVFPLEAGREALAYLEAGHARGKVVVKV